MTCPICTNGDGRSYVVRERMLGLGHSFTYRECARCGARYLLNQPHLASYYVDAYLCFQERPEGVAKNVCRVLRDRSYFDLKLLAPLRWFRPDLNLAALARTGVRQADTILDVGCGAGLTLHQLARLGFKGLTGIDPYIPDSLAGSSNGVTIHKIGTEDYQGSADLVLLNHVIEHVSDPVGLLTNIARFLRAGGRCLIRTPFADSWAADHFGPEWIQHDAPRHVVIHTRRSLSLAIHSAGLMVITQWDDSSEFQFWGSQGYQNGLSLSQIPRPGILGLRDRWRANRLNRQGRGDQGCIVVVRTANP